MVEDSNKNNFDFLRLVAATTVIVSHAYLLDGRTDPYLWLTGISPGWSAVVMFFAISGFLIAQSLQRRTLTEFLLARALRIFPGLAVCVFVTALALALLSNLSLGEYFASKETFKFVLGNATLLSTQYSLPGVFSDHRITQANGSIWTLRYEVACYIMLATISMATTSRPALRKVALALALIAGVFVPALPLLTHRSVSVQVLNLTELFMPFLVGSWVFWSNKRVTAFHFVASLSASVLLSRTPFYEPATTLTVAIFTLWIALTPFQVLAFARNRPDYSYGIYIYAYPIQQIISESFPALHPLAKASITFLAVLVPASLSWHFVEKPCLSFKKRWRSHSTSTIAKSGVSHEPQSGRIQITRVLKQGSDG
jgi:peptidoglycan/LPS O-acetylase OafA/YrhL